MTKEQLLKYAEQGVRSRLLTIHGELEDLAKHFPQVVAQFTGKPVPTPHQVKAMPNGKANGKAKVHHTQTPEWKAKASKASKAYWRKKRAEAKQAHA